MSASVISAHTAPANTLVPNGAPNSFYLSIVTVMTYIHEIVVDKRGVAIPFVEDANAQLDAVLDAIKRRENIDVIQGSYMYMHPKDNDQRTYLIKSSDDYLRFTRLYPRCACIKIILPKGAHIPASDRFEA